MRGRLGEGGIALAAPARAALGGTLAAMVAAALTIAAGAAAGPSFLVLFGRDNFPGWVAGPLAPLAGPSLSETAFALLMVAMVAAYAAALMLADALPARLALAGIAVLHLVFLLAPPLLTTDTFGYVDYARLGVVHDLNPYAHGADAAPADPLRPFAIWHDEPSPYGPLFTVLSYPLAMIDFRAAIWVVKAVAALASLGCVALVWRSARLLGRDPLRPSMLVGLNPVLLVWGVGGGHNDLLLMLVVLVGVERMLTLRPGAAGAALAAAAAVKLSAGLVLPFAVVGAARPGRTLAAAGAAAIGVLALALAVLGPDAVIDYPGAFATQQDLVSEYSVPTYAGELLGLGGATAGLRLAAVAALAIVAGTLLVRAARGADWLSSAGWATLALLVTTAWLMPWYLVWLLPFAALSRSRALVAAALAMTAFVVVTRLVVQ